MIVAGIDIGSRASKAVVMNNGSILSSIICDTGPESVKTSESTMKKLLEGTGLSIADLDYTVATGYGRVLVPFARENVSEISCHAKGVNWYFPSVSTILDMGGQDCKAIRVDTNGNVTNFVMNDKCAGGTGRFLEMIAEVLDTPLEDIGDLALTSNVVIPFNTICAVFAKSEAITYLRNGDEKSNILAGLNEAISTRCFNLLKRVTIEKDFAISGGIAKNKGMVIKISEKVGLEPFLAADPQIIGALGAALFARDRCNGSSGHQNLKISYGYSDGSGAYYIDIDEGKCDGCTECIPACPAGLFEMAKNDSGQMKAVVRDNVRKKIGLLCPGYNECKKDHPDNCRQVCKKEAIELSW